MQACPRHRRLALSAPPLTQIVDLAALLAGSWQVRKYGWDGVLRQAMRFSGHAVFSRANDILRFEERGTLSFGAYRGEAAQRYLFRPSGPAADVFFEDGRLFHRVDLSVPGAPVRHDCAADRYEGRYRVQGPAAWTVTWRITGPRKRQVIASRFERLS